MTDEAALLAQLPAWAFGFVLVLCRAGCACMLLPGVGEAEVPMLPRAGFALTLTLALLPPLQNGLPAAPPGVWQDMAMLGAEIATGLFLGWLARLVLLALPLAGQFIATLTGQSSVLQPDPGQGGQGTALGRLFGLAGTVLMLTTGLHALPLTALAGSYRVIPAGSLLPPGDTAQTVVAGLAAMFALALRLAAPFVLAAIVWNIALALVSRLVPQLQVFFLAAPAQLLGGLALLGLLAAALLQVWQDAAGAALGALPGL